MRRNCNGKLFWVNPFLLMRATRRNFGTPFFSMMKKQSITDLVQGRPQKWTTRGVNYLHCKGFRSLLSLISQLAYLLKGFGVVKSSYHTAFRAYEYRVRGITFLSLGPGWAYNFDYLHNALCKSFNYAYLPKSGDCIIDLGAGLGEETAIYAVLVGNTGKIHAVEANPYTYGGLKYMCDQNRFNWVVPHHLAIFNSEGEVTIEDDDQNYLTNTINVNKQKGLGARVRAKTLDSLVRDNGITSIDFLKANIEGAEQFMVEGMKNSVTIIRHLCISCHDFRHTQHKHGEFYMTKSKVIAFLKGNGFEVMTRNTGDALIDDYVYARNSNLG
jgi:FkbM family methyltransferase